MSRLTLGLLLAAIAVFALLATAPARLLPQIVGADRVVMQGLAGSVWRGRAASCLLKTGSGFLHLGELSWSLSPWSLLRFAPEVTVKSRWGQQTIDGSLSARGSKELTLRDLEINAPASLATQFLPLALEGMLSLQFDYLRLEQEVPRETSGRLVWRGGSWKSPLGRIPLGTYAMDLEQPRDAPLIGTILTLSGPVEAQGTVALRGQTYSVDARVSSEGGLDSQLRQALSLVAIPEGDAFRMRLSGDL